MEAERQAHGGKRPGAGRKRGQGRSGFLSHGARPKHFAADPVHVTMRALPSVPSFRSQRGLWAVHQAIRGATRHGAARITQFSAQANHVHLVVEAPDKESLARGIQSFAIRLARAMNRIGERKGRVWQDRHHRRDLRSVRAVRTALIYVLMNIRKHSRAWATERAQRGWPELDPYSSAPWFTGFSARAGPAVEDVLRRLRPWTLDRCPLAPSKTWLAKTGWKHAGGAIELDAMPRSSPFAAA